MFGIFKPSIDKTEQNKEDTRIQKYYIQIYRMSPWTIRTIQKNRKT